jgi:glutathione S-transferase
MITLWGRSSSSNVQKVLWCCTELAIPYEQIQVGREFGRNDEAWYLALNPNGLVPTIRDGDVVLWESHTILRYLAAQYQGERLYPVAPGPRARIDQWLDWQLSVMVPAIGPVFWGLIRTPEAERNMPAILIAAERMGKAWALVDRTLEGRAYLGGESLSLADMALGNSVHRWFSFAIERPELANLAGWYQRLQGHEGFHRHIFTPAIV